MTNEEKQKLLYLIQKNVTVFKKVSPTQYVIRCPLCGDSQTDMKDAHCYLKASLDPTEPILYNCFKGNCNSHGRVTKYFLNKLGIEDKDLCGFDNKIFNKVSSVKNTSIDIITGTPILDSSQVKYITQRLGIGFSSDDYDKFKIVWNMNNIIPYITDARLKKSLPNNIDSISFLSEDKSILLTRFFCNEEPRWRKSKIFESDGKSVYSIKASLDLFTKDDIFINIAEGVFDVLSIYKNFNNGENSIFIATLGSDYERGILYAINKGIVGNNVIIKIYLDDNIDEKILKGKLKSMKWMFKEIYIYKNILAEDVGKQINEIKLIEYKV